MDEDVVNLSYRPDIHIRFIELIQNGIRFRGPGIITAVIGALKVAGIGTHKWPGDHASHPVFALEDIAGGQADLIKFRYRDHILVRRDLETLSAEV